MLVGYFVNLIQAGIFREKWTPIKELLLSDWPVGKRASFFSLNGHQGRYHTWESVLANITKDAECDCSSMADVPVSASRLLPWLPFRMDWLQAVRWEQTSPFQEAFDQTLCHSNMKADSCLHEFMYILCMPGAGRGQRVLDSWNWSYHDI